jgi:hypothetical protein
VLSDAFHSTNDEIKLAKLGSEALGSENERLVGIFAGGRSAIDGYIEQIHRLGLEIDESAVKRAQEARSQLSLLSRVLSDELSSSLAGLIPTFGQLLPYMEKAGALVRDLLAALAQSDSTKPVESLNNEIQTLQNQLQAAIDLHDRLAADKPSATDSIRDKLREIIGPIFGVDLSENIADVDKTIAEIRQRISVLRQIVDEKNAIKTAPEAAAFKPRPSGDTDDSGSKDAFDRATDSVQRHTAATLADAEAVGLSAGEHAKLRTEAELTEALLRSGKEINDEYAATMDKLAAGAKSAADQLAAAKNSFQGINDAIRFGGNQLVDVLDRATQKGAKFGDIMADVLRNVSKQLLQAAITGEGAFSKLFGTNSKTGGVGGLGGLLAALFGKSGGSSVEPDRIYAANEFSPIDALAHNASGTDNWRGGATWVGENGPEIVNLPRGSQVIPNDVARGIGGGSTSVVFAPNITISGASTVTQSQLRAVLDEQNRTFQSKTVRALADARRRSVRV